MGSSDFPIPRDRLPRVHVSPEEHAACRREMDALLRETLDAYDRFWVQDRGEVDPRQWKHVGTKERLKLYRERSASGNDPRKSASARRSSASSSTGRTPNELIEDFADFTGPLSDGEELDPGLMLPATTTTTTPTAQDPWTPGRRTSRAKHPPRVMLMVGELVGRVEHAVASIVTRNQDELAFVNVFLHEDIADCAVLHVMEPPTEADPYHFLGYKWGVKKSPASSRLVRHRDTVYLESTGLHRRGGSDGETLGFFLLRSVELPEFPDLDERHCIRAIQEIRFLYRQTSDNVVEVFMLGSMEPAGQIFRPLATMLTADSLFAATKVMELAEARRLTRMVHAARRRRREDGGRRRLRTLSECSLCHQQKRFFNTVALAECGVCGLVACSRCRITKRIFLSDGILGHLQKLSCCKPCVLEANSLRPIPVIGSPTHRVGHITKSGSSSGSNSNSDHNPINTTPQTAPPPSVAAARRQPTSKDAEPSRRHRHRSSSEHTGKQLSRSAHATIGRREGLGSSDNSDEDDEDEDIGRSMGGLGHERGAKSKTKRRCESTSAISDADLRGRAAHSHRRSPVAAPDFTQSAPGGRVVQLMSPTTAAATAAGMGLSLASIPEPPSFTNSSPGVCVSSTTTPTPPAPSAAALARHRTVLFNQMLELQRRAESTYNTTQQNQRLLHEQGLHRPRQFFETTRVGRRVERR